MKQQPKVVQGNHDIILRLESIKAALIQIKNELS